MILASFGEDSLSPKATTLRSNIVRLVDKAVREYMFARNAILEQVAECQRPVEELMKGRVLHMFGFVDHMENSINAIRRVLKFLELLRSDRSAPPQDRTRRRLVRAHSEPLIGIRDTLEHIGERLDKGPISNDQPVILKLGDDQESIILLDSRLTFSSIETILRAVHDEAKDLIQKSSDLEWQT